MKYQKVALVSTPRQDLLRPPAAIPILAAACKEAGVDYEFYDFNLWLYKNLDHAHWVELDNNWTKIKSNAARESEFFQIFLAKLQEFIDKIITSNVDLISISVFTNWSVHSTVELIQAINQRPDRKNIKIVIGGTGIETCMENLVGQPIKMCDWLLDKNLIDYYIYGEGEVTFRALLNGDTLAPGINNYDTVQLENLDQFPYPEYEKIDPFQYNYIQWPELMINGSRGCVRHCTYCNVARFWPKFRFRSGESLGNELYHTWRTTGIHSFEFSDSLINGSLKEFRNLNKHILALRKQDPTFRISYKGQFICRTQGQFTENDYKEMSEAGCNYVYVGVETFSESVRYDMDKKFDNHSLDFHLKMCGKYGIENVFLMIVGYPTETYEDHLKNLEGLKKYQIYAQAGIINMITWGYTTWILHNTPLERMQTELGIVPEFEDFNKEINWVSLKNPTLTFKERVRRWIELVELADRLGYKQPRVDTSVAMLEESLQLASTKKQSLIIPIKESV